MRSGPSGGEQRRTGGPATPETDVPSGGSAAARREGGAGRPAAGNDASLPDDVDRIEHDGTRVIDLAALERRSEPTWTVDLDGPAAGRVPAAQDRRRRRTLRVWQSVAAVAVLLALTAGVVAAVTASRGEQWRRIAQGQRDRAAALQVQVDQATAAVAAADQLVRDAEAARSQVDAQLEAADGRLGAQEQDVRALEERVAALAAEKARLEDRLVVAGESQRLTASADASLVGCVQQVQGWLDRAPARSSEAMPTEASDAETTPPSATAAWEAWAAEASTWQASCDAALAAARG